MAECQRKQVNHETLDYLIDAVEYKTPDRIKSVGQCAEII